MGCSAQKLDTEGEGDIEARGGGRAGAGGQQCWVGTQRRKASLLLVF